MKKTIILLSLVFASLAAHADWKEDLANLFRNHAKTNPTATVDRRASVSLSQEQQDSIVNSILGQYTQGRISADSVVSLALYHKAGSPAVTDRLLRKVVTADNLRCATELGQLWALTPQFKSQEADGVKLLQAAAHDGYNDANAYLGLYYYNHKDFKKAKAYFDRCNPINFGFADTALGAMYLEGRGVKQDPAKAREYFHQAALKGYARGTSLYGHNLRASAAGPIDYPEAFAWLYIAGDLGDDTARTTLYLPTTGESFGEGESAEDTKTALHWIATVNNAKDVKNDPLYKEGFLPGLKAKEAAAQKGDDWARFYLGGMNYNGEFLDRNYAQAAKYYEPIARNGKLPKSALALVNSRLAKMYREGKGVKADAAKATRYAKAAAGYGSIEAYKATEHFN